MLRACVILYCTLCAGADSLGFDSYRLDLDISRLTGRFPRSSHLFWLPDGHAVGTENSAEMLDLLAHGTGRYSVRVIPEEARRDVYYLDAAVERGVVKSIRLSFEKPDGSVKSAGGALGAFEDRHPACSPVLSDLTRLYGRPEGPLNSSEERLENRKYVWKNDREELALVCGHYFGRARVFAMDVILKRLGN